MRFSRKGIGGSNPLVSANKVSRDKKGVFVKIGVAGGAGFIGSNLVEHLVIQGHQVAVFDNLETGSLENLSGLDYEFVNGDLRDVDGIRNFLFDKEIQYLVHLGALGSVPRSIAQPRQSFESNAIATLNVLEAIKEAKIPMVFSSSSSVYGSNPKLPKSETDWLSPLSPYAASKMASEGMCLAFKESFNVSVTIYRLFNVFGPRQNPDGVYAAVLPKWIVAAFNQKPLVVFGDGEQKRDFTYVNDVVSILYKSILAKHNAKYPVNLAFGHSLTLNRILDVFKDYFGNVKIEYREARKGDVRNSESDATQLYRLHDGNVEVTSIEQGLMETFDWFKTYYKF